MNEGEIMSKQFKIIYMKADFEPWWQFEGWEEYIVESWTYNSVEAYEAALKTLIEKMRAQYPNEKQKKEIFYAFWDEQEQEYCEGCDEDAQVFHGLITENLSEL